MEGRESIEEFSTRMIRNVAQSANAQQGTTESQSNKGAMSIVNFIKNRAGPRTAKSFANDAEPWFKQLTNDEKITLILASRKHSLVPEVEATLIEKYQNGMYSQKKPFQNFKALSAKLMAIVKKPGVVAPTQWNVVAMLLENDCKAIHHELVMNYLKPEMPALLYSDMVWTAVGFNQAKDSIKLRFAILTSAIIMGRAQAGVPPSDVDSDSDWEIWSKKISTTASDDKTIKMTDAPLPKELFASAFVPKPHELRRTSQYKQNPTDEKMNSDIILLCFWVINLYRSCLAKDAKLGSVSWSWDPAKDDMQSYFAARQYLNRLVRAMRKFPIQNTPASYSERLDMQRNLTFNAIITPF